MLLCNALSAQWHHLHAAAAAAVVGGRRRMSHAYAPLPQCVYTPSHCTCYLSTVLLFVI